MTPMPNGQRNPNLEHWPAAVASPEREKMVRIAREAWRELGFWFDCKARETCWKFCADRRGVNAMILVLREYLAGPEATENGDHLHVGPYSSLRIITGDRPLISRRGIAGRREDFLQLIRELEVHAAQSAVGVYPIARNFTQPDGFRALLQLEPDGFDPASADPAISREPQS
jgi:hypothetical protein